MSQPTVMVEYKAAGLLDKEGLPARVSVPKSAVEYRDQGALPPEVAAVFIEAAARAGVPVFSHPDAYLEDWPAACQPWPVFVCAGSDVIAEFYPATFGAQQASSAGEVGA
ncbi:MAG: hypothetical protein Q7V19_05475 [Bacteroidales bacterium]|nr:hypothetical protein [Bacteroidales bacterium]MDP2196348.1 hypothetical protein [Rhodocyclaceae bacterium]